MGLLYLGTPLTWDEAKKYAEHVRSHGITQFLHTWDRLKDRTGDELLWGDEVRLVLRSSGHVFLHRPVTLHRSNTWWLHSTTPRKMQNCLYAKLKF